MSISNLQKIIKESINIHKKLIGLNSEIDRAIKTIHNSLESGGKILLCGNGGSAADAQHLAAEFLVRLRPK